MKTYKQLLIESCKHLWHCLKHKQTEVLCVVDSIEDQFKVGRYKGTAKVYVDREVVCATEYLSDTSAEEAEEAACLMVLRDLIQAGIMSAKKEIDNRGVSQEVVDVELSSPMGQVIKTLMQERDYQDSMEDKAGSHVTSALNMGGIISAIQHNLNQATSAWYSELIPYPKTTDFLRKIGGLCIKAGQMYGMTKRVP